jgi:SAM-dependent methyltransferase
MARHKPFSKQRWMSSQKVELAHLKRQKESYENLLQIAENARRRYMPEIEAVAATLAEDAAILEIGPGPACVAQFIEAGNKSYIDPLMDDFRRAWPGGLPEGEFISAMAERINKPKQSFDLILSLRMLSNTQNPELVLHEIERLLKPEGTAIISVAVWPSLFARLHYFTAELFPQRALSNRLYCYTRPGIERTLKRHFDIVKTVRLPNQEAWTLQQEMLFVCRHLPESDD